MTDKEKLALALAALEKIANLPEDNCERYVERCDGIAVSALVAIETAD